MAATLKSEFASWLLHADPGACPPPIDVAEPARLCLPLHSSRAGQAMTDTHPTRAKSPHSRKKATVVSSPGRFKAVGKVGSAEVARVLDAHILIETAQTFFPDFDRDALKPHEHWLCPTHYDDESGRIPLPVHSWLIRLGDKTVLIDTCLGNDKVRPNMSEMHLLNTRYLERMADVGVRPEDVHYVLCTHMHGDHVGWNTRLENGRWVPTFPNAQYVMSRAEYEAAKIQAADHDCVPWIRNVFEDSLQPIVETGRAVLVDGIHELFDELTLRPSPGHTLGHMCVELRSQGAGAFFAGDLLHSPIQIPLWPWSTRYCWDSQMAAKSRREILELCAAENALLLPAHFQAPHVGRIRAANDRFGIEFGW
jgi:glyoxylase-like metal-dependent hydrolase (beta-lactamase superfamily II)